MTSDQKHWDAAYENRETAVSWHQIEATKSLQLIESLGVSSKAPIVDVGGGASTLVDGLIQRGYVDLTVLDLSDVAMRAAQQRLREDAGRVVWVAGDILAWDPVKKYAIWHDRAVLHFLTEADQQREYLEAMRSALDIGGFAVIGVFADDGPEKCSGLDVRGYSTSDLEALLGASYSTVGTSDEMHDTPSGGRQHFNWVVAKRIN